MAILALVIFWVLVGLGVFALAIRRTPRARETGRRPSRSRQRLSALGTAATVVAFGIAIPLLVIAAGSNDDAKAKGGLKLTSSQTDGRHLWTRNCATCHTLAATKSVGKVGPNLDTLRPNESLVLNAIKVGRARGQGQMPAELLQGQEATDVASFVAAVAGRD